MRPRYGPEPQAVLLVLDLPAPETTDSLAAAARRSGFEIRKAERREGYVETGWLDLATRRATSAPFDHLDRVIKVRFFADPVMGHTRLFAEYVVRIAWDPSVPERDLERMPDSTHAGRRLLDSLLLTVRPYVFHDTTRVTGGPPLREGAPDTSKAAPQRPRPIRRDST